MARNPHTVYAAELTERLWRYQRSAFVGQDSLFDPKYSVLPNPPVFLGEHSDLNVLVPEDAAVAAAVRALVPRDKQHRWFRSMRSSQALALSVFGNLKLLGLTDSLSQVMADDGAGPAFGRDQLRAKDVSLEYDLDTLNEVRSTSVDVFVSGPSVVCVECKLTEATVGRCSRPRLKRSHAEYCDGSYRQQGTRAKRCALTEVGIRYWDYISQILNWDVDRDYGVCPLAAPYQLVRNVLGAVVQDGTVDMGRGHALLVYDARNPVFRPHRGGAYEKLREQLRQPALLRRCSWQSIVTTMVDCHEVRWLVEQLRLKYGLVPAW